MRLYNQPSRGRSADLLIMDESAPTLPPDQNLRLTDFIDLNALQEMQDGFAAIAGVSAVVTDADGTVLTSPNPTAQFLKRQAALASQEDETPEPHRVGREYVAPIVIGETKLGTIRMRGGSESFTVDDEKAEKLAKRFGLEPQTVRELVAAATRDRNRRPAAVQFLFLLANAIARLCYQEYQLRQRIEIVETVNRVTLMLAQANDLQGVLDRTAELVADLFNARACSIRLVDEQEDELVIKAVYNLSPQYLNKGKISFSRSRIDTVALSEVGYAYVADMATDERVQYKEDAAREGIVSMLSVGMRYRGKAVGVVRLYSGTKREFSRSEIELLQSIAATAAAAIENTRLSEEEAQARELEEQINMAAEVQQRMIPQTPPSIPGIEFATVYVPCYQLGGDLYDFIPLPYDNLGITVADVSGKGVPASLIMASVRAALRAQVDNVYYLGEVLHRLNTMLVRDTKDTEFVTLFYGVYDTRNRRLTYTNAGHMPALLLRNGQVIELGAGDQGSIVLGVVENETFKQNFFDLQPGDKLLLYTDGLTESSNFENEQYGRARVVSSFQRDGATADMIAKNVLWDLRRFVGLKKPEDDITIVVAHVL